MEANLYSFLDFLMERFRKLSVCDVGIFKVCLFLFGALIGAYAHKTVKKSAPLLWLLFFASYAYLIYKLLIAPAIRSGEEKTLS